MTEIERLLELHGRVHEGDAWHGPSLRELLVDLNAAQATARPVPGAHSIWELVLHIAVWEEESARRLEGESSRRLEGADDFPPVEDPSEASWQAAKARLLASGRRFRDAAGGFPDGRLGDTVAGTTYYALLHGVVHHALYHGGQIGLIRKAVV